MKEDVLINKTRRGLLYFHVLEIGFFKSKTDCVYGVLGGKTYQQEAMCLC